MANNRMYLIHRPSGLGVSLGKRMVGPWYNAPDKNEMEMFYHHIFFNCDGSNDDFVLAVEDGRNSGCPDDWVPTEKTEGGFRVFKQLPGSEQDA